MNHELKIIIGSTTADTTVFLDEKPLGYIQDIKIHATVDNLIPTVEIVFPDFRPFRNSNKETVELFEEQLKLLSQIPNIKVTLAPLDFNDTEPVPHNISDEEFEESLKLVRDFKLP